MPKPAEFKVKPPLDKVRRKLMQLKNRVKNTRVPMQKSSIFLQSWVMRNFQAQGQNLKPASDRWPPFKEQTYKGQTFRGRLISTPRRSSRGRVRGAGNRSNYKPDPNAKLLQDTRTLMKSFRGFYSTANAGVRSKDELAEKHEFGDDHVPARRMLPTRAEVLGPLTKIITAHVDEQVKRTRRELKTLR